MPDIHHLEKGNVDVVDGGSNISSAVQKHESLHAHNRPYNDNEDHEHAPQMTFKRLMAFVAMGFLWTGSQIPIYFYGGILVNVYDDIGGRDRFVWMVLANLIALAAVCPFVGSLSDLLGRRWVAIIGAFFLVIGQAVCFGAKYNRSMNTFICGMALSGIGAGIEELTALAATAEMAPTASRGKYVAILIFSIVPFVPSVLYGGLITQAVGWQWNSVICGVWCFIGLVMTAIFYFPPPRPNVSGLSKKEIIRQIDYLGGFLSVSGLILLLGGLQWGGSQYSWSSAHVIAPLVLGVVLLAGFVIWEAWLAPYPMFPAGLKENPRVLGLTLWITFISGANFFAAFMFWPSEAYNVFGWDPVGVGLRALPLGYGIMIGACIVLFLLTITRGNIRALMVGSTIVMTAGTAALAIGEPHQLHKLWAPLIFAGLGIGGIIIPASTIITIVCPDDLIATASALTLSIRVIGGSFGYTTYYNIFVSKFRQIAKKELGSELVAAGWGIPDPTDPNTFLTGIIDLLSTSQFKHIETQVKQGLLKSPAEGHRVLKMDDFNILVDAAQRSFAKAYKYVFYSSIAYGVATIIAACFLDNIGDYMDDHVAVVIH